MVDINSLHCLVDIHLHLDGAMSVDTVRQLADLESIPLPEKEEELLDMLQVRKGCCSLEEYLEKFIFLCSLLQTKQALKLTAENLVRELAGQGLMYAEIRFAPQRHLEQGLTQEDAVEAVLEGVSGSQIPVQIILCGMRGNDNMDQNLKTVEVTRKYLGKGVCAYDLAGAEGLYPTKDFAELFALADRLDVPYTIHAGEGAGPLSVWQALQFHPSRLGHGIRSTEDPALLQELARRHMTLELCPTSNLHTGMYPDIARYPLRPLLEAGVPVTINTDNMHISGTTMKEEFLHVQEAFSLTDEEVYTMLLNAVNAAFTEEDRKKSLRLQLQKEFHFSE